MHHVSRFSKTAAVLCTACVSSIAQIVITDGSFEGISRTVTSPFLGGTTTNSIGAWTASASGLTGLRSSITAGTLLGGPLPEQGSYDLKFSVPVGLGASQSISQTLSVSLAPNTMYRLSVWVSAGSTVSLLNSASLQLRAGGNTVASLNGTSIASLLNPNGSFSQVSLQYQTGTTVPTGNIGLYFGMSSLAALGGNVYLDNFQLTATSLYTTAVPEPESYAIASGAALIGFAWLRHHRRKTVTSKTEIR
jgi:hypothetical protein